MRKTLSKMKFCAKTSRRGEGATAKAPEAELLAAPRASGLQEGRDRWWGLRRGSGARGHRGGGLAGFVLHFSNMFSDHVTVICCDYALYLC